MHYHGMMIILTYATSGCNVGLKKRFYDATMMTAILEDSRIALQTLARLHCGCE